MTVDGEVIVIGSGPAGVSAAESYRRHGGKLPVRILTEDPDSPYARPPLSKEYLRAETEDVALQSPRWFRDRGIEMVHAAVLEQVDAAERHVVAGGMRFPYAALVLATGAGPTPLPVPGGDRALQLRTLTDATRLRRAAAQASSAVVVGAASSAVRPRPLLPREGSP